MKKIFLTLLLSGIVFLGNIQAQVFNSKQDSTIQANINALIKNYEYYGVLTENDKNISQSMLLNFKKLFTPNAKIYNDIVKGKPKIMSIDDYLRAVIDTYPSGLGLTVKIEKTGKPEYIPASDKYLIKVLIKKDVFGNDKNGNLLDISKAKNELFIVFNKQLSSFKISEIKEDQVELASLILTFIDVDKSRPIEGVRAKLIYDGKEMQSKISNKSGKVVFKRVPGEKRVSIKLDEEQGYTTSSKISSKLAFKWANSGLEERRIYLKHIKEWQNLGFEVFGALAFSSISMDFIQTNYDAATINNSGKMVVNGGVNISYYFKSIKNSAFGIESGLHFDSYSADLSTNDYSQNSIQGMKDPEQDSYHLIVSANGVNDNIKLSYLGIPLLVNYRFWLKKPFINYIYANAGIKASFLLNGTSTLNGTSSYSGYYPQWDIVIKDIDYLDFYSNHGFNKKSDLEIKSFMISAVISAGVSIPLKKPEFSIVAGFDFGYSPMNISNYSAQDYYLSPKQQQYNSLAGASDKMNPMSYCFHLGVHYDLFK
jgi:hypothetical protein